MSKNSYKTTRVVYDIFGLITDLGGFNGTIVSLITVFMAFYTQTIFNYTIMKSLYMVSSKRDNFKIPY